MHNILLRILSVIIFVRLPVKKFTLQGATARKVCRLTEQVYLPITIGEEKTDVVAVIVPNLVSKLITGGHVASMDCYN